MSTMTASNTTKPAATPHKIELTPAEAKAMLDRGEAVLIDVREPMEHARERIEGARLVPLERLCAEAVGDTGGCRVILHCASGNRSGQGVRKLLEEHGVQVSHVTGGIAGWKQAGLPTVVNRKAPLPIMRQVQMVAGGLVLTGVVLGALFSQWFTVLSGFVGAGLFFAGASGWCGMAMLLAKMPWNRV